MTPEQRATHESAHAAIAALHGRAVSLVTLDGCTVEGLPEDADLGAVVAELEVAIAGVVACWPTAYVLDTHAADHDLHLAHRLAERVCASAGERRAMLELARERVRTRLDRPEVAARIGLLRGELLRRGRLDGAELAELLGESTEVAA